MYTSKNTTRYTRIYNSDLKVVMAKRAHLKIDMYAAHSVQIKLMVRIFGGFLWSVRVCV